ncbi:hypothetical protein MOO45_07615 [Bombilactobacillus folatiphilus]|uniref:Zinc-ribbon domain-containing protein n=1 Tax=Bombilactobacillus folatiphilus TaxID=2923362 RepID=A0ABY4P928_9LACO|nr:zinc ribbon domain-containing protein [Bombilactobacillus folatiphilus]UQS82044.1 hypothetical protein MOO45_07615 [Bombilactobacillus folatiphilus]
MRYCPQCGAKINSKAKKCPICGYQFGQSASRNVNQIDEQAPQKYSRSQKYHHSTGKPALNFAKWLKDNPLVLILAIIFVILTYFYVGKVVSFLAALVLIFGGYWHANHRQTNLDTKIKRAFGHAQQPIQNNLRPLKTNKTLPQQYQQPDLTQPVPIQANPQIVEVSQAKLTSGSGPKASRSWLLLIVAAILLSSSYWPGFFSANPLTILLGTNATANPSLAQTVQQALSLLNYYFHLQLNPALSLWIIAIGPLSVLFGALMPNHFGKKLANWGASLSVIFYLGGVAILHLIFSSISNVELQIPFAVGTTGHLILGISILLWILTLWDGHQFKQKYVRY